jgi:hypothetical protein
MHAMNRNFLWLLFLLLAMDTWAQDIGTLPSSIRWKQIDTAYVRIIYPAESRSQAIRAASIIQYINDSTYAEFGSRRKKVNIVLNNRESYTNGFVTVAPFRSEFFPMPSQNSNLLGSLPAVDQLSIHEYRHVMQYTEGLRGLTRLMYWLQGEGGWGVMLNIAAPNWYFEGDAVFAETYYTNQGRGRIPNFLAEQRAVLMIHPQLYSYQKARNGSYKDIVPDHYRLGYTMNLYMNDREGIHTPARIYTLASTFTHPFYSFSRASKRITGLTTTQWYRQSYAEMAAAKKKQLDSLELSPSVAISREPAEPAYYLQAYQANDGSYIAWRYSYNRIPAIVQIDSTLREEEVVKPGFAVDDYFSMRGDYLAWTEVNYHARFSGLNYSDVVIYDRRKKKKRTITNKQRYFSPDISNDRQRVAVIRMDEEQRSSVAIIDIHTGDVLQQIPNPDGYELSYPRWSQADEKIIVAGTKDSKMTLLSFSLHNAMQEVLIRPVGQIISRPYVQGKRVWFSSSASGIDNIYELDLESGSTYRLSSVAYGAYSPAMGTDGKTLIYSEITGKGQSLRALKTVEQRVAFRAWMNAGQQAYLPGKLNAGSRNILAGIPGYSFPERNYKQLPHLLRIHSWNAIISENSYGLRLSSTNILTNMNAIAEVIYNHNDRATSYALGLQYAGWFPVLSLNAAKILNRSYLQYRSDSLGNDRLDEISYNEQQWVAGVSVPLFDVKGPWQRSLSVSVKGTLSSLDLPGSASQWVSYMNSSLMFSNYLRKARKQVAPRWGQRVVLYEDRGLQHTSRQYGVEGSFYFPGIYITHSLLLSQGFQSRSIRNIFYNFSDRFVYARGYEAIRYKEVFRSGFNYQFPLCYPDAGLASIVYLSRLRTNIFYDHSVLKGTVQGNLLNRSAGVELIVDTRIINTVPLTFNVRWAQLLDPDPVSPGTRSQLSLNLIQLF